MNDQSQRRIEETTAAPVSAEMSATSATVGEERLLRMDHSIHAHPQKIVMSTKAPAIWSHRLDRAVDTSLIGLLVTLCLAPTSILFSMILPHVIIACLITSVAAVIHAIWSLIIRKGYKK